MKVFTIIAIFILALASFTMAGGSLDPDGNTSDIVIGSDTTLDNLDPSTYLAWVRVDTLAGQSNRRFYTKGGRNWRLNGTTGNFELIMSRTGTNTQYITDDTPLATTGKWYFVAATFDTGASAGEIVNLYTGDATTLAVESTYGTATDGTLGLASDATADGVIYNNSPPGTISFPGPIAHFHIVAKVLTIDEVREQQYRPHVLPDSRAFFYIGLNGTSTQFDLTGNGNNGTVDSFTELADGAPFQIGTGGN